MTGRQNADLRGIYHSRRADRWADIATAAAIGIALAAVLFFNF